MAYEHDEDFRGHLPLLFHATLTAMDAPEPLVYQHAQQLLVNLLYSLSARHLELHKAAGGWPEACMSMLLARSEQKTKKQKETRGTWVHHTKLHLKLLSPALLPVSVALQWGVLG